MQDEENPLTPNYSGFIIVRLAHGASLEKTDDLRKVVKSRFPGLAAFLDRHKEIATRRLIRSVDPEELLAMERKASFSEFAPQHSLTQYWRLDCRTLEHSLEEIVRTLRNRADVELAYAERIVRDPTVDPSDDPLSELQGYLDAAPEGIDARWAWTQANGDGAGVGFMDLEQGWFLSHEDLIAKTPTLIFNNNRNGVGTYRGDHGTAVLGEVVGVDNALGIVGVAPGVTSVRVTSHYELSSNTSLHIADAMVAAVRVMSTGDVLLLEAERDSLPAEIDDADYRAIRLATASGIVVIEAAGNGGSNLDAWVGVDGRRLDRTPANDSGAILVGACRSAPPRNRRNSSNYGSRLDCFAWGENIVTTGYGDLDPDAPDNSKYTVQFDQTSGAAPIVGGAALIVQGMYQAGHGGGRLSASQMRALLSDPATGTHQGPDVAGFIGVMPDLRAIIGSLGLSPDLYLRDFVGDTGVLPSTGAISASPDIIVRPAVVADPNASFGEGSGTENSDSLSSEVEAGQDNFIYVRMRNRSNSAAASNATVIVYWSESATLVTPDLWHRIGETVPVNVPAGDSLVVAGPITWPAADIPTTGHYCFIGIINQARDLAPRIPPAVDWDGFCAFIRNNNSVTWRNFNVIDEASDTSVESFMVAGAPDCSRVFDLELIQRLPEKAHVFLEMPIQLFASLPRDAFLRVDLDRKEQIARVSLPKLRGLQMGTVKLKKAARHRCRLIVTGLKGKKALGHSVAIRQLYEGHEVGRITWVFRHNSQNKNDDRPSGKKRPSRK